MKAWQSSLSMTALLSGLEEVQIRKGRRTDGGAGQWPALDGPPSRLKSSRHREDEDDTEADEDEDEAEEDEEEAAAEQ
eukprot:CAMPEP_0206624430 /NCGR_PEP_ID=MMETSP0325_2-20121206/64117_1 /ASSEMBLY_ACC=CAM_ASM_000347 /TAXON_ID=2866 /ORGANISM="Crypthecodinium cohnii, Strain Seligo" /LENGTH=77 /DNA_ID=CAMNT_0054148385 /DNA_START=326 /DNA_END=559 /DNA_ORIENTATION=+